MHFRMHSVSFIYIGSRYTETYTLTANRIIENNIEETTERNAVRIFFSIGLNSDTAVIVPHDTTHS